MATLSRTELARRTAVNPETIRFYERSGLLPPPPRSPAGYRQFPPEAVGQLERIKSLRQLGFPLRKIRQLLRLRAAPGPLAVAVEGQLSDLGQRVRQLRALLRSQSGAPPPGPD